MARNLDNEPQLAVADIQGDVLVGLPKRHEHLMFFRISDAEKFKVFLKTLAITSAQECLDKRAAIAANKARGDETLIPTPGLNVALSFSGMQALSIGGGLPDDLGAFQNGMAASQAALGDPPSGNWEVLRPNNNLHGVFVLTGASHAEVVDIITLRLAPPAASGFEILHEEIGQVRPDPVRGHEHFGYADGVSQPGVRGTVAPGVPLTARTGTDEDQGAPGQDLLWPGEFVFGYPEQKFDRNSDNNSFTEKGDVKEPPIPFMKNGAFLVFRRLAQLVPEFDASVKSAAMSIGGDSDKASADLLGAQLVGRWKSGAPLELASTADNPDFAENTLFANAFEFGEDREGVKCPWAAHIRKAYPRDDVRHDTAPSEQAISNAEAFTQTHRMLRRGIAFGPELTEQEALEQQSAGGQETRGLLFKCYVTSIEEQFEFVQQQWVNAGDFSQPESGVDAIIGQSNDEQRPFLGAAPVSEQAANKPHFMLKGFVRMQGGGYFFTPSISALKEL